MLLERLGLVTTADDRLASSAVIPSSGGDVAQVRDLPAGVAAAFGINVSTERVTRREAKTIPSVRRGEQVIAGTISGFPLVAQRVADGEDGRPSPVLPDRTPIRRRVLEHPDPQITPAEWKRRVVEDLIYAPWSWCRKVGTDAYGFPAQLHHLDHRGITIDPSRGIFRYNGVVVPPAELVRFDSPGNGLLVDGAVVLRTALKLEAAVRRYAENDVPLGVLYDESNASATGRQRLTDDDVDRILDKWTAGARKRTTRWIGRLRYQAIQFDAARIQLAEARQRSDVAIAQLLNLDSQQINAPGESSMTYVNLASVAADRVSAIRPYMDAVVERLSWNDITPRGQRVVFDTTRYLRGTVKDAIDAAVAATGGPVMSRDEARATFFDLPPLEELEAGPTAEEATR